jgi:RHS repeat-associated protein
MDHNAMGMDPCDNQNDAIFNITTDKRTHVDARTGLFEVHVPLPSVTGNVGYGPVVDLSLYYSPVVNNHAALGDGWSFAFTTWYEKNSDLTLHTGEALRLEKGKDLITPAVMVTWSDGGNTLTVERKDGRVEILRKPEAGRVWVPARLTTDGYRYLDFTWATVAQTVGKDTCHQVRLTGIRDPDRTLLDVTYGPDEMLPAMVTLTYWPGTDETLQFLLDIKNVALQSVTAPEGTTTTFGYLEHPTCGWLLNSVETFEGLKEDVAYADNGLNFKNNPKLSALPAVNTHTVTPRAGGEKVIDRYKYFWNNAAGRRDVGLMEPGGYQTEIDNGPRHVAYLYSSDHQMLLDYFIQGACKKSRTFDRFERGGKEARKSVTTHYGAAVQDFVYSAFSEKGVVFQSGNSSFSRFTYGEEYNERSKAGAFDNIYIVTEHTGALPIDSESFSVRHSMGAFLDLPSAIGDASRPGGTIRPLIEKKHTYKKVHGLNRKKPRIIQHTVGASGDAYRAAHFAEETSYFEEDDFRKGRQKNVRRGNAKDNLSHYTADPGIRGEEASITFDVSTGTYLTFDYVLDEGRTALTTTATEQRDGSSQTSSETRSVLSGRLISQTDVDGNTTTYAYDAHGRLTLLTVCAQSETYREKSTYAYPSVGRLEITGPDGQVQAVETDGRDNTVREQVRSAKGWRDLVATDYDEFGRKKTSTHYDYLLDETQVAEICEIGYDDWGNECIHSFSDGRTLFNQYDPASRLREEWSGLSTDKRRKRTTYRIDDSVERVEWLDANGSVFKTQSFTYTDAGKLSIARTTGLSATQIVSYGYDAAGRVLSEEHQQDEQTFTYRYTYPTDWLIEGPTKIEIDFDGTTKTLGERTSDAWGRVTSLTRAGVTETHTYAGAQKVPTTTTTADGKTLSFEYIKELNNRVSKVSEQGSSRMKSFSYMHGTHRKSTASEGEGECKMAFDHDLNGRVTTTHARSAGTKESEYEHQWSPGGRLLFEIKPDNNAIIYEHDGKGRRTRTEDRVITTHIYDSRGRMAREFLGMCQDIAVTYAFDASGRESRRRYFMEDHFDLSVERHYDENDRLVSVELRDGATSKGRRNYSYTGAGRLASCETSGEWRPKNPRGKPIDRQVYSYDCLGNVTKCVTTFEGGVCQSTYYYDTTSGSRLVKVEHDHGDYRPSTVLEYDTNGRVTRDALGKTYSYDWLGRLVQAGSRYYTYDAMDRLAETKGEDQAYELFYRGQKIHAEYGPDDTGRSLVAGSAACNMLMVERSGVSRTLYEFRDADGTVLATYDATAKTMKHHAYSAYGEHSSREADSLLGFQGEYRDTDNDQYPLGQGYRWYDPSCMRFHVPDAWSPFGRGGPNAYRYADGDPVNRHDPGGHMAVGSSAVNSGLRQTWGNTLPGPLSMGKDGGLVSTIIWGGLGILTAIATGGASLLLAAAMVGLAIASAATAIVSVLVSESNPELATTLAWVSFGAGIAGGAAMLGRKIGELALKLGRSGINAVRDIYARGSAAMRQQLIRVGRSHRGVPGSVSRLRGPAQGMVDDALGAVRPTSRSLGSIVDDALGSLTPRPAQSGIGKFWDKYMQAFDLDDVAVVVGGVTGVIGATGSATSEDGATANTWLNVNAMLPWSQFR